MRLRKPHEPGRFATQEGSIMSDTTHQFPGTAHAGHVRDDAAGPEYAHYRIVPARHHARTAGTVLAVVLIGNLMRRHGRLYESAAFLKLCQIASPLGFVAVLAGWVTTEVGRQPWTVYGLLRTADSVSPSLTGGNVLLSLIGYMAVYLIIFSSGLIIMTRLLRRGPEASAPHEPIEGGHPAEPMLALPHVSGAGVAP